MAFGIVLLARTKKTWWKCIYYVSYVLTSWEWNLAYFPFVSEKNTLIDHDPWSKVKYLSYYSSNCLDIINLKDIKIGVQAAKMFSVQNCLLFKCIFLLQILPLWHTETHWCIKVVITLMNFPFHKSTSSDDDVPSFPSSMSSTCIVEVKLRKKPQN